MNESQNISHIVNIGETVKVEFVYAGTPADERVGDKRRITFFAEASEMTDLERVSNKLNPRDPNLKTHAPSKRMRAQVAEAPEMFQFKNMGIHIIGSHAKLDRGVATVHAISQVNGRHTAKLLGVLSAEGKDLSKVRVPVHIYINFSKDEATDISNGLNDQVRVDAVSMENQTGKFDSLFDALPSEYHKNIERRRNAGDTQGAKYDVVDLLKRLAVLNPKLFPSTVRQPTQVYSQAGSLLKQFSEKNYAHLYPLVEDALNLEQRVVRFFEKVNGHKSKDNPNPIPLTDRGKKKKGDKWLDNKIAKSMMTMSGHQSAITPPDAIVLMAMAPFRCFVVDGKWMRNGEETTLSELWASYGEIACRATYKAFDDCGKGAHFDDFGKQSNNWKVVENEVLNAIR
jgi:hypothetical protein